MKPVVGRAPQPLLSSCPACQSAHLACSVKDCFEHPLCCCSGSFVATCLGRISSSLQWLQKANSSSDATAVSLVRQLSRCSACFCSPLWVRDMLRHESQELHKRLFPIVGETKYWRFGTPKIQRNLSSLCTAVQAGRRLISSVSCSLSSACLSAGRQEVKVKNGGHLVQRSAHCRFPWSLSVFGGIGLAKAMATLRRWSLTFVCLAPNEDKNWALLVSPLPGTSLCFTSRKVEGILCSTQHWQFFCAIQQCIPLLQFLLRERTVSDNGH